MITGEIRRQIDAVWNEFWSGGVANPLSVVEQIIHLLFIKRLDEVQTLRDDKRRWLGIEGDPIFPAGAGELTTRSFPYGCPYDLMRPRNFKKESVSHE